MSSPVLNQRQEGNVRVLELNRPYARNALNQELILTLTQALHTANEDPEVRCIVLTGAGNAFCSGADLKAAFIEDPELLDHLPQRMDEYHSVIRAIVHSPKPYVAAVPGAAVGFGCDLALACEIRYVSPEAYFQEKFVKIGLMPDGGGTFWLPRLVGLARAFEMMYTGDPVTAEQAVAIGIANRMLANEQELHQETMNLAQRIAQGPPLALAALKRSVRESYQGSIEQALDLEKEGQLTCLRSQDCMEGVMSWMQKRTPVFQGK
jgi:2-(1,2-epoxy-1,2-dihydrophenyl)acetyl-CoA isomerase